MPNPDRFPRAQWLLDNSKNLTYLCLGMAAVLVFTVAGLKSGLKDGDVTAGALAILGIIFGGGIAAKGVQGMNDTALAKAENPQPQKDTP